MTWMSRAFRQGLVLAILFLLLPLSVMLATASCLMLLMSTPFYLKALGILPAACVYGYWRLYLGAQSGVSTRCPRHVIGLVWLTNLLSVITLALAVLQLLPLTPVGYWYVCSPLMLHIMLNLLEKLSSNANFAPSHNLRTTNNSRPGFVRVLALSWLFVIGAITLTACLGTVALHGFEGLSRLFLPREWMNWALLLAATLPALQAFMYSTRPSMEQKN